MVHPWERRKSIRVKIIVSLKHGKCKSGALTSDLVDALTKDLSTGGLSFASPVSYFLEEEIYLKIDLPGWKQGEIVIGKVVRCQDIGGGQYGIGVQFITINKAFEEAIAEYVY